MEVPLGDTFYFKFTTRSFSTGVPTQLAGTPVVDIYEENNLTQITGAETLTVDYDSVTGLNDVAVVCSGANGFEAGKYYQAVITTGTVGGVSVVGECVGPCFRIVPAEDAGAGIRDVNVTHVSDVAEDIATETKQNTAQTDLDTITGSDGVTLATAQGLYAPSKAGDAMTLSAGAITDASLAGNMEIVFETDFATNYNTTRNAWATNVQDTVGTGTLGLNDLSAAEVNTEVDTALADIGLDHLINSALPTSWAVDVAANSVFDQIADDGTAAYDRTTDSLQATRDHIGDGTNLTEAGGTGDHLTAIDLPDQTMNITGNLSGSVGSVTGAVGSVTGAVGSVTGAVGSVAGNVDGNVTGSVGSLAAQAKTDVNTEVLDVLNTDTFAEPTGVPGATVTLATKIGYLYMALRNKVTVTSTKKTFYDDGDTAEWEKDLSDNGTTYTESEGNAI